MALAWRRTRPYAVVNTAIVNIFGGAPCGHGFPLEPGMLRDAFVAVFAGADDDEDGVLLTEEQKQ